MVREIWYAQDGKVLISGTLFSSGIIGSGFTAIVKEISLTGGGRDIEGVRAFGSGNNFYVFEKGQEMIEASITTVKQNNFLSRAINGSGTNSYPMMTTGDGLRNPVDLFYEFEDRYDLSGAAFRVKMGTAYMTSREMSLSVDDHIEETVTFKCAPENYQEQYTNDRVTNALTLTL